MITRTSGLTDDTRAILMRVLTGKGTDLDKLDMISNLIAEKMAMSEAMSDKLTEGSFVQGHGVLKHLLSLDRVLETMSLMETVGKHDVPEFCVVTDGDCIGKN